MGTHHGKDGLVKVGSNTIAEVQSFSVEQSMDLAEDTSVGDSAKTFLPGIYGWTGTVECSWDETDTNGQNALTIGASVTLNLYPEGAGSGATYLTGSAIITSINWTHSRTDVVRRSFNFTGNGALTPNATA